MGISSNGILFYGYLLPEYEDWEYQDITDPEYDDPGDIRETRRHRLEVIGERWGVVFSDHCSSEYPVPYVAINERKVTARRGHPQEIDPGFLVIGDDWRERLDGALREALLTPLGGPGWFVASYIG